MATMLPRGLYSEIDISQLQLLPLHWAQQIEHLVAEHGILTHLDGKSPTSREPADSAGADVVVVMGDVIAKQLGWLFDLYRGPLLELCREVAGPGIQISSDERSAMNINALKGRGSHYEWHVDTNPLTGILYVTSHSAIDGGELVFRTNDGMTRVAPRAGMFIAFDARELTHTVLPLNSDAVRISVPMNYYDQAGTVRPAGLDQYLYRAESGSCG